MKSLKYWKILATLSVTLLISCQDVDLPGSNNPPPLNPDQGSITPEPKGPKPLDGLVLDVGKSATNNTALSPEHEFTVPPAAGDASMAAPTAPSDITAGEPAGGQTVPQPAPTGTPDPNSETTIDPNSEVQEASNYFYFSYDDSASTAGVEQTKYALRNGFLPNPSWVRPWEFLNYESFHSKSPENLGTFDVSMGLWRHTSAQAEGLSDYDLGVHVTGPTISNAERRNLILTLAVDVSGSMENTSVQVDENAPTPTLLELVRSGLKTLAEQLKPGDIVNLVAFSTAADTRIQGFEYTGDKTEFLQAVDSLQGLTGTNLNAGLKAAYDLAQAYFDDSKINRVIMLTDAFANQGSVDSQLIARNTRINDLEGIYFSGLGFGYNFNEAFLNDLTEAGKGTYYSVITQTDAERAFGDRFMSLVNIAARNVRFKLEYPAALKRTVSAAEQSSQIAEEVDPIHFSYNSSQFFLERFRSDDETAVNTGTFKLTIDYTDPVSGIKKTEIIEKSLEEILNQELPNIQDARVITLLTSMIRGETSPETGRKELNELLKGFGSALANEYKEYIETWLSLKGF